MQCTFFGVGFHLRDGCLGFGTRLFYRNKAHRSNWRLASAIGVSGKTLHVSVFSCVVRFRSQEVSSPTSAMRRVVRKKATSEYLSPYGKWVTDFRLALDFENMESAILNVEHLHLEDVELVLVMGEEASAPSDPSLTIS